jgi:uncharacterized protein involved in type VI secretion and phage assembly
MPEITKLSFDIIEADYEIAVEHFSAEEKMSAPYAVMLNLVSEDQIQFNDVITQEALLTIAGQDADRHFHGIINNFMLTGKVDRFYT